MNTQTVSGLYSLTNQVCCRATRQQWSHSRGFFRGAIEARSDGRPRIRTVVVSDKAADRWRFIDSGDVRAADVCRSLWVEAPTAFFGAEYRDAGAPILSTSAAGEHLYVLTDQTPVVRGVDHTYSRIAGRTSHCPGTSQA